jgi:8-amino-7-oxononanoate synthase
MDDFETQLSGDLEAIHEAGLWRELRAIKSAQARRIRFDGREFLNFSSNDYLGLASHAGLGQAATEAIERFGVGSGASRLVCGSLDPHHELEVVMEGWLDAESALVFSSGFAAAQGVITSVVGKGDVLVIDKKVHASTVDAAKLSGAKLRVFRHNDLENLESILRWAINKGGRVLVVTETVFSMDGNSPDLENLVELKERYGAWLMLDEAHALGCYGEVGGGLAKHLAKRVEIRLGTLGKAVGAAGGFVCGSRCLIELLVNKARSFIFSTAPSPALSAAAFTGIKLIRSSEGAELRNRLWARVEQLRDGVVGKGWMVPNNPSVILPIVIGNEAKAMAAMDHLSEAGLFIPAIRFPTVARNEARLRVTVSASHTEDDVARLLDALAAIR